MLTFTLYSRRDCHLCEEMLHALQGLCAGEEVRIDVVDIDTDAELSRRYGLNIPVLACDGKELCRYHLDTEAVRRTLAGNKHKKGTDLFSN